ncbi:MAG: TRAP transporter small permease subunit [Geminicoccaceae bacterium]
MPGLRALLRLIDRLSWAAAIVAAACLALLAIVILAEVISVWAFNKSLEFSWEYGAFFMAGSFFLGLGWTLGEGGHVRVGILAEHLPSAAARLLDLAATIIALIIAGFLTFALAGLAWSSFSDGSRTFTATATPLVIPQAVITIGALILTLQLVARLVRLIWPEASSTASDMRAR